MESVSNAHDHQGDAVTMHTEVAVGEMGAHSDGDASADLGEHDDQHASDHASDDDGDDDSDDDDDDGYDNEDGDHDTTGAHRAQKDHEGDERQDGVHSARAGDTDASAAAQLELSRTRRGGVHAAPLPRKERRRTDADRARCRCGRQNPCKCGKRALNAAAPLPDGAGGVDGALPRPPSQQQRPQQPLLAKRKKPTAAAAAAAAASSASAVDASKRRASRVRKVESLAVREAPPPVTVRLSRVHRSPPIRLSPDALTATGDKGFRTVRATHAAPAASGDWYFEVRVHEQQPSNAHVRVGWATTSADLSVPVGFDHCSYAYRDADGTKFHQSVGMPYGEPYGPGDVIGCHLHLPTIAVPGAESVSFLPGARISFFKNGASQGVAFVPLGRGVYFPAVSLFMGATVTVNFGPSSAIETMPVADQNSCAVSGDAPDVAIDAATSSSASSTVSASASADDAAHASANAIAKSAATVKGAADAAPKKWWFPPQGLARPIRALAELAPVVDAVRSDDGVWICDR